MRTKPLVNSYVEQKYLQKLFSGPFVNHVTSAWWYHSMTQATKLYLVEKFLHKLTDQVESASDRKVSWRNFQTIPF